MTGDATSTILQLIEFLLGFIRSSALGAITAISILVVTGFLWGPLIMALRKKPGKPASEEHTKWDWECILIVAVIVVLSATIETYPRLLSGVPVGGDTYSYAYEINLIKMHGPLWGLSYLANPLSLYLFSLFRLVSGVQAVDTFKLIPGVLAALFVLSTASFAYEISDQDNWRLMVIVAAFVAGTSTFALRTFTDLYTTLLGVSVQNFSLASLAKSKGKNRTWILVSGSLYATLFMIHWPIFLLMTMQMALFSAIILSRERSGQKALGSLSMFFIPASILAAILIALQSLYPSLATPAYFVFRTIFPDNSLFGKATSASLSGQGSFFFPGPRPLERYVFNVLLGDIGPSWGNPIPSLFTLFGFSALAHNKWSPLVLYSNVATLSILIMLPISGISSQSYRIALLFPIPILSAYGFSMLWRLRQMTRVHLRIYNRIGKQGLQYLSAFLLLFLLVPTSLIAAIDYQNLLAVSPYTVGQAATSEIHTLTQTFGVGNSRLIVAVRDYNSWANIAAYVSPGVLYFGDLAFLLNHKVQPNSPKSTLPEYIGGLQTLQRFYPGSPLSDFIIAITANTYDPLPLELQYLESLGGGIYVVPSRTLENPGQFLNQWISYLGLNFTPAGSSWVGIMNETGIKASAQNDAPSGWANVTIRDGKLIANYANISSGWNLHSGIELPLGSENLSQYRYLAISFMTDVSPAAVRAWIIDSAGLYAYWDATSAAQQQWNPSSIVNLTLSIPRFTSYSQGFNLTSSKRVEITITPLMSTLTGFIRISTFQLSQGRPSDFTAGPIPDFLTYNPPLGYITFFFVMAFFALLVFILAERPDIPAWLLLKAKHSARSFSGKFLHSRRNNMT